jgi:hypothetical protein
VLETIKPFGVLGKPNKTMSKVTLKKEENQFKQSIEQHITNMYNLALEEFYNAQNYLTENPRSHSAKAEWSKYLSEKQTLEDLLHHIDQGWYDSEDYYTNYLNPKTRFKQINSSLNK